MSKKYDYQYLSIYISPNFTNNRLQSYLNSLLDVIQLKVSLQNPLKLMENYKNNRNENKIEHDDFNNIDNDNCTDDKLDNNNAKNKIRKENNNIQDNINITNMFGFQNPIDKNSHYYYLIYDYFKLQELLLRVEELSNYFMKNETELKLTIIIIGIIGEKSIFNKFKFFVESEYKILVINLESNESLIIFTENLIRSIPDKHIKSNIEFYDCKFNVQLSTYFDEEFEDDLIPTFMKQLMCIPGVTEHKALAISRKYSFKKLLSAYNSSSLMLKQRENLLASIEYKNKNNENIKKIGELVSKRIYNYFTTYDGNEILL